MTDLTVTIAALRALRISLQPYYRKAVDDAVEALEEAEKVIRATDELSEIGLFDPVPGRAWRDKYGSGA